MDVTLLIRGMLCARARACVLVGAAGASSVCEVVDTMRTCREVKNLEDLIEMENKYRLAIVEKGM